MRLGIETIMSSLKVKIESVGAKGMMRNMEEKMKSVAAESMLNSTRVKLKEMASKMQEKLKEIGAENMMSNRRLKENGAEARINNLQEKIKELLELVQNIGRRISPPEEFRRLSTVEKLEQWLHLNAPYIVMGLILLLVLWGCSHCFRYHSRMKTAKMMKAPGRNFRIRRTDFEANPRSYFRSLRSGKAKHG